jgi:hypothetical protein
MTETTGTAPEAAGCDPNREPLKSRAQAAFETWEARLSPGEPRSALDGDEFLDYRGAWEAAVRVVAEPLEREIEALKGRLKAAETYCVLSGWQGSRMATDEEKALHQLWSEWATIAGSEFTGPGAHPELSGAEIAKLARKRDEIRARTLAAIREQHPDLIARTEIVRTEAEAGQSS